MPVDGINMDRVTDFIQATPGPKGPILLYLGWTPEGKNPWITLREEDAEAVFQWLVAPGLVDPVAVGTSS
jgi:hypothetical protein